MSELLPCPFCGAGHTEIVENGRIWTGTRYSEPTSISVRHWCETVEGQPSRSIERVGRDFPSAIAAWNKRAAAPTPEPVAWRQMIHDRWNYFHGSMDPREVHDTGRPCEPLYTHPAPVAAPYATQR